MELTDLIFDGPLKQVADFLTAFASHNVTSWRAGKGVRDRE